MKITGTKKILILLITLLCAIAVGLGISFTKAYKSASAKEVETVAGTQDGDELTPPDSSISENAEDEQTPAEEEDVYDPRFDEAELRALAEALNLDYELVNFYAHATNTSVAELNAKLEAGCDGEHGEDEDCNDLSNIIANYKVDYIGGLVTLAAEVEDEDWYIAPDEASSYATYTFCGYDTDVTLTITSSIRGNITSSVTSSWTYYAPNVYGWGDVYNSANLQSLPIASEQIENGTRPTQGGWGRYTTLTLELGETVTISTSNRSHHYSNQSWQTNHQWAGSYNNSQGSGYSGYAIIDGDAPTGSYYMVGSSFNTNAASAGYLTCCYKQSASGCTTSTNRNAYYWAKTWWNEFLIVRKELARPTIVDDGDGGTISGTTKTMYYTGEAARISFYPDWGSGVLSWSCPNPSVVIYDRSIHGTECKNLTLETQVAGTYYITLSTPANRWADGSTGSVTFTFILQKQTTTQPQMVREAGVAENLKSKTVNDNGQDQTVTFINCDKRFLSWESNGLYEAEWTDDGRLTLYQSLQNVYSIQIFITNPDGCSWTNGTSAAMSFTFTIKEMLIDTPVQIGQAGNSKTVLYDGNSQSMTLGPAKAGQLSILAPGLPYAFTADNTVEFSSVNAQNFTIRIAPATGYVWRDQTTTMLTFTFTIEAIKLTAPKLDEPTAVNGRKTAVYKPSGEANTLKIKNIRSNEVIVSTAMNRLSWEGDTLILGATEAYTYYVSFDVANSNYEWAAGTTVSTFVLVIERYTLRVPYLMTTDEELDAGLIEGNTKTVAYEADPSEKYIKLFTGGVIGQLTVEVEKGSSDSGGLNPNWDAENTILTLTGTEANNYLIKITPTNNYQWDDGTFELKDFKLVISPILRNSIPMYIQNSGGGSSAWDFASGGKGSLQYEPGTQKRFRIGNMDNFNEYYDSSAMYFDYVIPNGTDTTSDSFTCRVISQAESGLTLIYEGNYVEFAATDAGEYWIRLNLRSTNYAWRDGSGISFYFVFTVTAMPLETPYIVKDECGGYEVGNKIYPTYMYGIYDGNDFTMTISIKAASYVIATFYDAEYNPDTEMRQTSWAPGEDIDRLVVKAHSVGTHTVRLEINDKNYRWADERVPFYEFSIRIDYAQITGVTFTFGENSGVNGMMFGSEYITGTTPNQTITVTRTDPEEFVNTPFKEQFEWKIEEMNGGSIQNTSVNVENFSSYELSFLDAGVYIVSIYPNDNYCWKDGTRTAHICILNISKKKVDLPTIRTSQDGGQVDTNLQTKKVTYTKGNLYLVLDLGKDYPAYAVDAGRTSSGLRRDIITDDYGNPDVIAYYAVNVDTYELGIKLASSVNYEWDYGNVFIYTLAIEKLGIGGPEAYVSDVKIDNEHISDVATSGTRMTHGAEQKTIKTFKGEDYFVYLIGESVLGFAGGGANADVEVEVSLAKQASEYSSLANGSRVRSTGRYVFNSGIITGYEYEASQVNTYTITVTLVSQNCYWKPESGSSSQEDTDARVFTLQIEKRVLDLPKIKGEESQTLVDDSYHKTYIYSGGHQSIEITGYLYGGSIHYMDYNPSILCDVIADFENTGFISLNLTTDLGPNGPTAANVAGDYHLTITLDSDNERWSVDGDNDNVTPKYYYIDIEKLPVTAPTVSSPLTPSLIESQDDTSVSVIYNANRWANAMTVNDLDSRWLSYKLATPSTTDGVYSADTMSLAVSTTVATAGSYTVIVSLSDPSNMSWAGTSGDSSDLELSFIIKPQPVAKPVVFDPDGGTNTAAVFTDTSLTVTYNNAIQYIYILNYLNNSEQNIMSSEVISSCQFISGVYNDATEQLVFSAKNAGQYTVRFSISVNAEWDDGSGNAPVDITFNIDKLQYNTPFVTPEDENDTTVSASGLERTVTYALDASGNAVEYFIKIAEFDDEIMSLVGLTSTRDEYPFTDCNIDGDGNRVFSAKYAGTYTVTFKMNDFENMRWDFADRETITLTLKINKLVLDTPHVNQDYLVTGESVTGNSMLSSVYNGKVHSVILENVLNTYYMTYEDTSNYAAMNTTLHLTYDGASRADNSGYPTVGDIYLASHPALYSHPHDGNTTPITLNDFITLSAVEPGTYTLTFNIADREDAGSENMVWSDGTYTAKTATIAITKMALSSPVVRPGTSQNQQYNGGYVYFYLNNVDNGYADVTDWNNKTASTYQYVTYTLGQAITSTQNPVWEVEYCYGGSLVLKAVEVGTYSVTVSIYNTETTVWTDFSLPQRTFTFTVSKRDVTASFEFNSTDPTTQTNLDNAAAARTVPEWSVSTPVTVTVTISGLCMRFTGMDKEIAAEIYYTTAGGTTATFKKIVSASAWSAPVLEANGQTYSVSYTYAIPYGELNISKGTYTLNVVQNGSTGNYTLNRTTKNFKIAPDPAPFDTDWLVWRYKVDDGAYVTVDPTTDLDANGVLHLDFLESGGTYYFSLYMTTAGMNGKDTVESALLDWEVRLDRYTGTQSAKYYGSYTVSAKIVAKDSDLYFFADYTTTLKYSIDSVLYDLSGLTWDYSGTPFTYDGTVKTVRITGTLPSGLTVLMYIDDANFDLNSQIYVAQYTSKVKFTSSNPNYKLPDENDSSTYIGPFDWTCTWDIEPQELVVGWRNTQAADGSSVSYVPVLDSHGDKVDYVYYIYDGSNYVETDTFVPNSQYKVEAILKSNPGDPATDYARNYKLKFNAPEVNPTTFNLGPNTGISTTVTVRDTTLSPVNDNTFYYDGEEFEAAVSIVDPTGSLDENNVVLTYYSAVNYNKPLAGAPKDPGSYRVKLSLIDLPNNGISYALDYAYYDFIVEKGSFDLDNIIIQYTHTNSDDETIVAVYDDFYEKWIRTDNSQEVTEFVYDGLPHTVELISTDENLEVILSGQTRTDAGDYITKVSFVYDGVRWEAPAISGEIEWTIEKATLDLSLIDWVYEDNFIYTISGGKEVEYSVELENVPELLLDYITYTTSHNGDSVSNSQSQAGSYVTTCVIEDLPENSNYVVGEWPSSVVHALDWDIHTRKLTVPAVNGSWPAFDGTQHNLLTAVTLDVDWETYFEISVTKSGLDYDGTKDYGFKYFAFHADTYVLNCNIKSALNKDNTNVEWIVYVGALETYTTAPQTVNVVIPSADMEVYDWIVDDESSTVLLRGAYVSDKFVGYKFYAGSTGSGVEKTLDEVLNSNNATFSIVPYILPAYSSDISLSFAIGVARYQVFTTPDYDSIPDDDWNIIPRTPYITGYTIDGVYHEITREEWMELLGLDDSMSEDDITAALNDREAKKDAVISVTYSGKPVTFEIFNWDYYTNQLEVWNGTLDDLTVNEAGTYSITFMLKKDTVNPRSWGKLEDGSYDRSAVTLKFAVKYRMLSVPELDDLTFNFEEQDILEATLGAEGYQKLLEEYGDYVEITGSKATDAGTYTLYMTIKDEYVNTVRWDNGSELGLPGTISIDWTILPIYLVKPTLDPSLSITYDGYSHTVYEVLKGYEDGVLSEELELLKASARLSVNGGSGVNAGTYTAVFSLPSGNFAWIDANGNIDTNSDSVSVIWYISRYYLDLSKIGWSYDETNPFVYTIENGIPKGFTLELTGIPVELKEFITYLTDGSRVNTKIEAGTYKTIVYFFDSDVDANNYELGAMPSVFYNKYKATESGYLEITWKIEQRTYGKPDDAFGGEGGVLSSEGEWEYDGSVHELMELLGYEDGWENYLDVTVEYDPDGVDGTEHGFARYEGYDYSIYKAYYLGSYRITIKIKTGVNETGAIRVVLGDGSSTEQVVTVTYKQLVLDITGWTENDQYSTIISDKYDDLSQTAKDLFEYVIYDADAYDSSPESARVYEYVTAEEIAANPSGGGRYYIEFRLKSGSEYHNEGVKLTGITRYEFGSYNFDDQPIINWVPLPKLDITSADFTGADISFSIIDWEKYVITQDFIDNWAYDAVGYHIPTGANSFIYSLDGSLDTATGVVKAKKAGTYKLVLRFTGNINLSWYDSTVYEVNSDGNLVEISSGNEITDPDDIADLINRYAQTLEYKINVAKLQPIDISKLENLLIEIEYTGTPKNVFNYSTFLTEIKQKYGSLIEFENDIKTDAGEYQLIIKLTDPESSYWDLGTSETVTVNAEGYALRWVRAGTSWQLLYVAVDESGEVKLDGEGNYTEYNDGDYKKNVTYKYSYQVTYVEIGEGDDSLLDGDGNLVDATVEYVTDENGNLKRYSLVNGAYVERADGTHLAKYILNTEGEKILNYLPDRDANGNFVIIEGDSSVTVDVKKTSTEPYTADWKITQVGYASPYINHELDIVYNGKETFLVNAKYGDSNVVVSEGYKADELENTSVLIGYVASIMEAEAEGASGTDAGEYTIVLKLTDGNHFWEETGTDTLELKWYIVKATVDLSEVEWSYTEDTVYTYTRLEDGTSQIFHVELLNLPEALQGKVLYTTNNKVGAYAGREAGKFITTFKFDINENNFNPISIPDTLPQSITWTIERCKLDIPANNETWVVFDDETHDLLEILELPEDWPLYYSITVYYAKDFILYEKYEGYDGDPYAAHGAGSYKFRFSILDGINTNPDNPNVVWNLGKDTQDEPVEGEPVSYALYVPDEYNFVEEDGAEELLTAPDASDYGVTPYAEEGEEGEEGGNGGSADKVIGDDEIADPLPSDPDDFDWSIFDQYLDIGVEKLVFLVTGWTGASSDARVIINYNPEGKYDQAIIDKIMTLDFLTYEIYDVDGNLLPAETAVAIIRERGYGHTYFVRPKVKGESANYIELIFDKPEYEMFDFSTGYPSGTNTTKIDRPTELYFSAEYTGEDITFEIPFYAQHSGYMLIFEGEEALTQRNVGKYTITLCFKDNTYYSWKSSSENTIDRSAVTITLEILAMTVSVDTEITCGGYTGSPIDLAELLKELYGDKVVPVSTTKITKAGTYEVKIMINPSYGGNLFFKDNEVNSDGSVTIKWTIPKAAIGGEWNEIGMVDFSKDTSYLGVYENVVRYTYEDTKTHEIFTSITQLTKDREYKAVITLLDEDNFVWADGFQTEYIFTLGVDILTMPKPELEVSTISYAGSEITFVIKNWEEIYKDNVEIIEGSLTQTNADTYQVTLRITNKYALWSTDGVESNDDYTFEFTITKAVLNGTWDRSAGTIDMHGFDDCIIYVYTDMDGKELSKEQLVSGGTYRVTIYLTETAERNFTFATGLETSIVFTLDSEIREITIPTIKNPVRGYTGSAIDFMIDNWAELSQYITIVDGGFTYTNAGPYYVILGLKDTSSKWSDGTSGNIRIDFSIEKVALDGVWGNNGRVTFNSNTYEGSNYNSIVQYEYRLKSTGEKVQYTDLKEGETYIATISIKDSAKQNFRFADNFNETYEFSFAKASNWWIWLLVALAAVLFIVIIIIIIIVIKRRAQTKYEYEDVYEDGYYDEEGDGEDFSVSGDGVEADGGSDAGDYGSDAGDYGSDAGDYGSDGGDYSSDSSDGGYDSGSTSSDSDGFDF